MAITQDNFADAQIEQYVSQEDLVKVKSELITCPDINSNLCGHIYELSKNHAKSIFISSNEMVVDDQGLVHSAFIFSAANYVALAAINREFSVLISSKTYFYSTLKLGDVLYLEAQAMFDENSRKREVRVLGFVKEIKIFEATMQVVITDTHIFKMERPQNKKQGKEEKEDSEKDEASAKIPGSDVDAMAQVASIVGAKA
ncbi:hypothetical protein [uncultured Campylobacter sp.]|uniref:hypothetical protein n=1 Tax=uncultured Campylobacter sp. TaxID=218934 RepID=UPI003434895B